MRLSLAVIPVLVVMLGGCASAAMPRSEKSDRVRAAAEVQVTLGQKYMEQGKLEVSMEKLQKALIYDPSFADAHTVIAVLFERIGNSREAELHYRRAAELLPKNGDVNNNYGTFLCHAGKFEEAERYFDLAIADPFYKTPNVAYANAGSCQLRAGKLDKAEASLRRSIELYPVSAGTLYQLALVLFQKSDYFKARAFIQRFDALAQPSADALLLGNRIELKLGNERAANEYGRRLRTEFPDSEQSRSLESSNPS